MLQRDYETGKALSSKHLWSLKKSNNIKQRLWSIGLLYYSYNYFYSYLLLKSNNNNNNKKKKNISLPFQACPTHQIIVQHSQVQKRSNSHSASDAAFLLQWSCGHLGPCPARVIGWRSWDGNDDGAGRKRKSLLYYSFASHIFCTNHHPLNPLEPQFRASLIHNRITLKSLAGSRQLI